MRQYWADIYENREDAESINKLETDFIVNECGHYVQEEGGARRPTGRMDYQILYIAAGRVYFWLDGKRETAESGTMVVYPPYEKQIYTYDHSLSLPMSTGSIFLAATHHPFCKILIFHVSP